jgi:polyphenol oxidase
LSDGPDLIEVTIPGGTVAFTTRRGGTSRGAWEDFNLGAECGDRVQDVLENRIRLAGALRFEPERFRSSRQVHGGRLQVHREPIVEGAFLAPEAGLEEADGHFTEVIDLPLVVTVADCAPVFISGPSGVALLHCGWRGLLTDLIGQASMETGKGKAVIGPHIGPCCFEVGPEVRDLFGSEGGGRSGYLDIGSVIASRLKGAGVELVESVGRCTSCEREAFFSHRRDQGQTGRQAAVGWRTGE